MKTTRHLAALAFTLLAGQAAAADNPRCLAEYKAEEERIIREAGRNAAANPPGKDLQAQQQQMAPVHDALKAAADKAERCNRDSRPPLPADSHQRMTQCAETADRQMVELRSRYAGRSSLSFEEQTTIRNEEDRISKTRMDCMQKATR